jgi:hypothetical protein
MTERLAAALDSDDAKERLCIMLRDDGLYRFMLDYQVIDADGEPCWTPRDFSGLYSSLEDAEREARHAIPWLGQKSLYRTNDAMPSSPKNGGEKA